MSGSAADPSTLLTALRAALRDRLAEAEAQVVALRRARGEETADDEHDPEGPTLSAEWSRAEGHRADLQDELSGVEAALARVRDGTYGVCVDCGRPIPAERLVLRPAADRCVPCASGR